MKLKDRAWRIRLNASKIIDMFWPARDRETTYKRLRIRDIQFLIEDAEREAWMRGFRAGQKDAMKGRNEVIDALSQRNTIPRRS